MKKCISIYIYIYIYKSISLKFCLVDILKLQSLKGGGKAYNIKCKPKINRPNGRYHGTYACTVWHLDKYMINKKASEHGYVALCRG
jgi:hypothetical protein